MSRVKAELASRGFGVLWELDVPAKLAEKGVRYDGEHRILEVCNPHDAKVALEAEPSVAYFLPCKVVIYRNGDGSIIGMPRPSALMSAIGDGALSELAARVESELKAALDAV